MNILRIQCCCNSFSPCVQSHHRVLVEAQIFSVVYCVTPGAPACQQPTRSISSHPEHKHPPKSHLNLNYKLQTTAPSYKNNKSHSPWFRTEDAYPPLFFRKLPGSRNVYAQMHNEKEQEMTSPVNHSEDTQHIIQGEEFIDDDLDSQTLGNAGGSPAFRSLIRTTTNHCY